MRNWILVSTAAMLLSIFALGQATPISSTTDQSQSAAAPQKSTHARKAKAHHAKAHHVSRKKHRKTT